MLPFICYCNCKSYDRVQTPVHKPASFTHSSRDNVEWASASIFPSFALINGRRGWRALVFLWKSSPVRSLQPRLPHLIILAVFKQSEALIDFSQITHQGTLK